MVSQIHSSHKVCQLAELTKHRIEQDYSKVVRIRQLLGIAAVENIGTNNVIHHKSDLTIQLKRLFSTIVPFECQSEDIFEIVTIAADLRYEITREFAIYSFYWCAADEKIDLDSNFCEFEGWSDDDPFLLCVFPGFGESIKLDDGSIKEVCINPAKVILE